MDWGQIDRDEWEALTADAPLQQTWRWGEVLADGGARVVRLAARQGREVLAVAQVAARRLGPVPLSLVSRGPVWTCVPPEAPVLGSLARALGGARLMLVTPDAGRIGRAVPVVTPAWHAELDITPPRDALRAGLGQKFRNSVSRAERLGLDVRRDDAAPTRYDWLLQAEARQQRERGYRNWPPGMVNAWHAHGGAVRVHAVRRGDTTLAAMLFLLHGRVATYQIGWAGTEGRRMAAHPLCFWHAVDQLKAEGIERIDLGTVNTEDAPGLARFKIGTGAVVRPLGATHLVQPRWAAG